MKKIKFDFWIILLSISLAFAIAFFSGEESKFIEIFSLYIDPTLGILTFLIATLIAYRSWTEKLPKKLTIHFKHNNQYTFTCHKAYLSDKGDIRQWGQQIGKQMNNLDNLDFYPHIKEETPKIEYIKNGEIKKGGYLRWLVSNYFYKHYTVTFFLSKEPKNYPNNYKIWWNNDSDQLKNKEIVLQGRCKNEMTEKEAEKIWQKENKNTSSVNT